MEIVATLESVAESVEWLRANPQPDLLFMDIHLADGDSFRIFDAVEVTAPVIFTTAYDRYALEAFKVNSIDYLLKPLNAADVQRALGKLMRLSKGERSDFLVQKCTEAGAAGIVFFSCTRCVAKVRNFTNFGVFVEIEEGIDGLVHISKLADKRIEKVEDACKVGDMMWVKFMEIDEKGRWNLSHKDAMKEIRAKEAAGEKIQ